MTYFGTTAGSTAANPPLVVFSGAGGLVQYPGDLTTAVKGSKVWLYVSTNVRTDVITTGFFTDGVRLGMWPGDLMLGVFTGSPEGAGTTGGTTEAYAYRGCLWSTETSVTTGAYSLTSNCST